MFKKITTNNSV